MIHVVEIIREFVGERVRVRGKSVPLPPPHPDPLPQILRVHI
jgi:hypothetical protein